MVVGDVLLKPRLQIKHRRKIVFVQSSLTLIYSLLRIGTSIRDLKISMPHEIVFREKYGALGKKVVYIKPPDQNAVVCLVPTQTLPSTFIDGIAHFIRQVFLPQGYPESVSDDYFKYQLWDTVQAFCSTLSGTLTTQAIMKGVGVGDTAATPLAAAITWILKDGTGMIGRIVFAWFEGTSLDGNCKKWRLFADALNDMAMFLELLLPTFVQHSTSILCVATAMKAIVGVAGGATRAAITQHQAVRNNMADVSAKDGSQETCVNLCASIAGIVILSTFDEGEYIWQMFTVFTIIHLYANFRAVKSLKMLTVNISRLNLLIDDYLHTEAVNNPEVTNFQESVILGYGHSDVDLCGFRIKLGTSLQCILGNGKTTAEEVKLLANFYSSKKYLILTDLKSRRIFVSFQQGESTLHVIQAYFHAVMLGIGVAIAHNIPLKITRDPTSHTVLRLQQALQRIRTSDSDTRSVRIPLEAMMAVQETVANEFHMFISEMLEKGWNVESHHLTVDEWRGDWKIPKKIE